MSDIIEVKNLTKNFNGFKAVDNISFTVKKGEIFAFLGPNGAGKTTTIKMLTTLLDPTHGELYLDGQSAITARNKVRTSFGIVFQDPSLDEELTAYENMYFHSVLYKVDKHLRDKRIKELLEFVELWDRRNDLVKKFSGGMKRRLEIARGFLHRPKVLFLDEPTLGLDPQTTNHIWTYIKDLNKNESITVFFTTHYMAEAQKIADRIAIIDRGKIIIIGTLSELTLKTNTNSLEEAFLALTGKNLRDEEASNLEHLRNHRRMRRH